MLALGRFRPRRGGVGRQECEVRLSSSSFFAAVDGENRRTIM